MGKRKLPAKSLAVYRDNSDDEATPVDVPHARMVQASEDHRRLYISPPSPQKTKGRTLLLGTQLWVEEGCELDFGNIPEETAEDDGDVIVVKPPAKRYPTSVSADISIECMFTVNTKDAPLREWMGHGNSPGYRQEYLEEELRRDARPDSHSSGCPSCTRQPSLDTDYEPSPGLSPAIFRCRDCLGSVMECSSCLVLGHRRLPFHHIQVGIY